LKAAVNNIPLNKGDHAIVIGQDFPSDHYTMREWCRKNKKELKIVDAPHLASGRGAAWTEKILNAITKETSAIILSTIHWADGTKFDLKKIGERCREVKRLFHRGRDTIRGRASYGRKCVQNRRIGLCRLKWLMGPYSMGLAYYSEVFDGGTPLEDSWMTRSNARDFTGLPRTLTDMAPVQAATIWVNSAIYSHAND
jgi:hypothetical protein